MKEIENKAKIFVLNQFKQMDVEIITWCLFLDFDCSQNLQFLQTKHFDPLLTGTVVII